MTVFIIFVIACIVIFGGGYLFIIIKDYIEDNYITPRKVNNTFKRVEAKAKEISKTYKGIVVIDDVGGSYVYQDGRMYFSKKGITYPLYQKFNGTYTDEESDDCVYVGYVDGCSLYRNKDKNGKEGKFDKLGNPIIESYHTNSTIVDYGIDDYYENTGSSGGNVEDDSSRPFQTTEWRADGSWGDVYYKNGVQTDEWGNPL